MSRGRRQVIQLDEPARIFYSNEPVHENEEDDEDSYGEMPTPERLVTDDMMQCQPPPPASVPVSSAGMEIDNKVANFLAEIDALDPGGDAESSRSPAPPRTQDMSPPRDSYSPARERSPPRNKPNAYSNMFVKGASEFVRKPEDTEGSGHSKKIEPWPEEPKSDWQQLTDEKTTYPYYWNTATNEVVWDMPAEFSQFLLRHKEYEEKVEKGLREGTLDPAQRGKSTTTSAQEDGDAQKLGVRDSVKQSKSASRHARRSSRSEDSSSDSSDSDNSRSRDSPRRSRKGRLEKHEVSSSSAENSRAASHDKLQRSATPDLPDSTRSEDKRVSTSKQSSKEADSMDFDIDDIDKELEMALERKRQELMKAEGKKEETDEGKSGDRKKDEHRHRDDEKKDERHRKHGHHRDYERSRDSDRRHEREEKKPKLTLKERLRIEMELKMEKERRRKRAIEEMMARELEQTVGSSSRHKRHRDDREKSHKRYRHDDDEYRPVHDDYRDYGRGYDDWRGASLYDDRFLPPMKPPPPTAEMIAYEEERKSQVVDYGHGRSHSYDINGDSDTEESRSADVREMEVKKLEALQLAELALSKLEFLEVTKKGLSKLQILLIELETRHQDWQAGGLTTNHFLNKLSEANWQLEQYEASAAPAGWVCSWDRDYRRYFYTHKLTGKTQWDYPDADEILAEDEKGQEKKNRSKQGWESEREISSTSDRGKSVQNVEKDILASMSLPPPPPPPAEEHPSVKSLMLMYGSSSDSEQEEPASKKPKAEPEPAPVTELDSVPLPPPPPEESQKEKKDKHRKKKKKEKHKKKEKEKAETGVIGPLGPAFPPPSLEAPPTSIEAPPIISEAPPPPPPPEVSSGAAFQMSNEGEIQAYSDIPVYGSVDDEQQGLNDQPLEFSTVPQEVSAPHPYASNDMEGVESSTFISHGPQVMASSSSGPSLSHEPEPYTSSAGPATSFPDPWASEGVGDGYSGEATAEGTYGVTPGTEEKKKKKKDKMGAGSISLKKKHVSSMVQKWQKVKKEVELEEQNRQIREAEIRRKLAELE